MRSLFGRKKAESQEKNPYEQQQQAQEAYDRMTPYQRARADNAGTGPRPNGLPSGPGPRRGPSPAQSQASTYSASNYSGSTVAGSGYAPDRYGSPAGYGNNRFDQNANAYGQNQNITVGRPGGYGGLGARPEDEAVSAPIPGVDPNRYRPGPQMPKPAEAPGRYDAGSQYPSAPGEPSPYDDDDDPNLTQEQRAENKELARIRRERKHVLNEGSATLDRTEAMLNQILDTGENIASRVAAQGDSIGRAHQNINLASAHAREAEAKTKELKNASRSMFRPDFSSSKKQKHLEQAYLEQSQADRREREDIRSAQYRDRQNYEQSSNKLQERMNRFALEDDSETDSDHESEDGMDAEDRKMDKNIDRRLARMHGTLGFAKERMIETGETIALQNQRLDTLANKTDGVSDHVIKNSAKLRAFK